MKAISESKLREVNDKDKPDAIFQLTVSREGSAFVPDNTPSNVERAGDLEKTLDKFFGRNLLLLPLFLLLLLRPFSSLKNN